MDRECKMIEKTWDSEPKSYWQPIMGIKWLNTAGEWVDTHPERPCAQQNYDTQGNITALIIWEYDSQGNIIAQQNYDSQGNIIAQWEYDSKLDRNYSC